MAGMRNGNGRGVPEHCATLLVCVHDHFGIERNRSFARRDKALVAKAKTADATHTVSKPKLEDETANYVVQPRTEPATSDDASADLSRFEEHSIARTREFESRELFERLDIFRQLRQAIVDQDLVRLAHKEHRSFA
jgi:hypothetical protein